MDTIAVKTIGLSRNFGSIRAVDDLSLEVPAGTIFGFLGPNGAGKTTSIRLLLGLLKPTAGKAEVLGIDPTTHGDEVRGQCGVLLEHDGLYERLTAEQNLDLYCRIWRLPAGDREARTKELLGPMQLWERRKEVVVNWSRGMKRKLALARALIHKPPVVFLDEPTAGLDPEAASSLRNDLVSLAAGQGVTVFMNTHNLAEAEKVCGLVAIINKGKLIAFGHPGELMPKRRTMCVEIAGHNFSEELIVSLQSRPGVHSAEMADGLISLEVERAADIASIVSLIVHSGGAVEEVRKKKASLEEVFLTLVEEKE